MSTSKPLTDRYPTAVLAWVAALLRTQGTAVSIYHDLAADAILVFDRTVEPVKQSAIGSNRARLMCAAELLRRFVPGETMPPPATYKKNRKGGGGPPTAPPAAPKPSPPRSPLDQAQRDGLG